MKEITNEQIKKIHTLVSVLKWKDDWYRDSLYAYYDVKTSKELTCRQAEDFIENLESEAVEKGVWKSFNRRSGMASYKQVYMINSMWNDISVIEDPEKRKTALRKLLEKIVKVSDLRFLRKGDVKKVVACMKAMKKSKEKKEQAQAC